jgi:hypothetical protein
VLRRHVAYVNCLAAHLKGQPCPEEVRAFIPGDEFARNGATNNFANDILTGSAALLAREYKVGHLDSIRLARLESTLVDLSNAQGGMERIANTPLPYPYVYFPRLFISLFCLIVPVGLDLLSVSVGFTIPDTNIPWGPAFMGPIAERVRREAGIPVTSAWGFGTPQLAEGALQAGHLDLVSVGRAHLADPHWAYFAAKELGVDKSSWTLPAPYAHWLERYR